MPLPPIDPRLPRVAVAGATGFIGRRLCALLRQRGHAVIGLGRGVQDGVEQDGVLWRRVDLFSLLQCERALEGAELVYYLVHSMSPSARLTQARFEDMDLILADNLARAAARRGVRRILYLGGLVPPDPELSPHLASRREVEDALGAHGVSVTTLRAGLVIGPEGSSFRILERLVARLPAMLLPRWTRQRCQPIALDDALELLARAAQDPRTEGLAFDIGGPEVLSYRRLIEHTAEAMGLSRALVDVPVGSPFLSELWVTAVTGQPRQLTGPLIESLEHSMLARDRALQRALGVEGLPVAEAIRRALAGETACPQVRVPRAPPERARRTVRSVQRMRLPPGVDAEQAAQLYLDWLPSFLWPLLRVEGEHPGARRVCMRGVRLTLLELSWSAARSTPDRALLYVTGGLLAKVRQPPRGRLELRTVSDGQTLLAAIHDFEPRLPWMLYLATQAQVHLWVMHGFRRDLARRGARSAEAALP
ncbi:MAG: NAD-dependent epimerase/dehydratase family protein [Alphaproteobacteria bacterium]|nr:NAD-dependent epimerase/dehydratase family protein [Alphaproteobacteria bacterium]